MIGQISPFVNPVRYTLPDDFYANNGDQRTDEIIASWNKVFDLSRYTPDWDPEPSRHTIQATLWEVHRSQFKKSGTLYCKITKPRLCRRTGA